MDPFLVKMGRTGQKKKKNHFMYRLCPTRNAVFPTKSKKIKNVIHASFLVKPSRDKPKKREKKFSFWLPFLPTRYGASLKKIPKK